MLGHLWLPCEFIQKRVRGIKRQGGNVPEGAVTKIGLMSIMLHVPGRGLIKAMVQEKSTMAFASEQPPFDGFGQPRQTIDVRRSIK